MSIRNVLFLLVALCIVASGNTQLLQLPLPFPIPPSLVMPDITKCFSTLMNIPGCIAEISQSIVTYKFGNIGSAYCKAFMEAETNCTPNLSFNPFLIPLLKEHCSKVASPPTTM
ncbi:hypothetical protein N665_0084s0017 [Sinapis alba]|nr:hypothetical protein N665_0084s0017 [Sinapis alba]